MGNVFVVGVALVAHFEGSIQQDIIKVTSEKKIENVKKTVYCALFMLTHRTKVGPKLG